VRSASIPEQDRASARDDFCRLFHADIDDRRLRLMHFAGGNTRESFLEWVLSGGKSVLVRRS